MLVSTTVLFYIYIQYRFPANAFGSHADTPSEYVNSSHGGVTTPVKAWKAVVRIYDQSQ